MNHKKIMILTALAVLAIGLLSACDRPKDTVLPVRVVEKSVPIIEIRPVPEELMRKPVPADQLPTFIPPGVSSSSCLSPEGEARLRIIMIDRESRLEAWEKWGVLP
jgi:hypothetical protein